MGKGLFFGGQLFYVNKTFYEIFNITAGLGLKNKAILSSRLEIKHDLKLSLTYLTDFRPFLKREVLGLLNSYYSQVHSVNSKIKDLTLLNVVRIYLIKSYRGRCHLLGKPVRGQRT